jgi:hypothetical protein
LVRAEDAPALSQKNSAEHYKSLGWRRLQVVITHFLNRGRPGLTHPRL